MTTAAHTHTDAVYAAALAALPGCGPSRLRTLLAGRRSPAEAWSALVEGRVDADRRLRDAWRIAAASIDRAAIERALHSAGLAVVVRGDDDYPALLVDDPEPPPVLFARGDLACANPATPRVAIIGTRRCTGYGRDVARTLGHDLAAAGVAVVSGLAAGIDGAAHEGALAAARDVVGVPMAGDDRDLVPDRAVAVDRPWGRPIGVVGSGLDVVYPRRHRRLWNDVGAHGLLLSEAPLGSAPEPWRFPLRNRIIAALADVVVVVESHAAGGSMHTVQAAIDRGIPVMAVPGSVRSPASTGTNRLLADGAAPVLDATDVLVALSLDSTARNGADDAQNTNPQPDVDATAAAVLGAVDWSPTPTEDVLRRTSLDLGTAAAALTRLEMAGLVRNSNTNAGQWERR